MKPYWTLTGYYQPSSQRFYFLKKKKNIDFSKAKLKTWYLMYNNPIHFLEIDTKTSCGDVNVKFHSTEKRHKTTFQNKCTFCFSNKLKKKKILCVLQNFFFLSFSFLIFSLVHNWLLYKIIFIIAVNRFSKWRCFLIEQPWFSLVTVALYISTAH